MSPRPKRDFKARNEKTIKDFPASGQEDRIMYTNSVQCLIFIKWHQIFKNNTKNTPLFEGSVNQLLKISRLGDTQADIALINETFLEFCIWYFFLDLQ